MTSKGKRGFRGFRKERGDAGEASAVRWLEGRGYEVVARNFLCHGGELDIVARKDDELVFVEVKTRGSREFGGPAEAVDARKRGRMVRAAEIYLLRFGARPPVCRFDVVQVENTAGGGIAVSHLPDAFRPGWDA